MTDNCLHNPVYNECVSALDLDSCFLRDVERGESGAQTTLGDCKKLGSQFSNGYFVDGGDISVFLCGGKDTFVKFSKVVSVGEEQLSPECRRDTYRCKPPCKSEGRVVEFVSDQKTDQSAEVQAASAILRDIQCNEARDVVYPPVILEPQSMMEEAMKKMKKGGLTLEKAQDIWNCRCNDLPACPPESGFDAKEPRCRAEPQIRKSERTSNDVLIPVDIGALTSESSARLIEVVDRLIAGSYALIGADRIGDDKDVYQMACKDTDKYCSDRSKAARALVDLFKIRKSLINIKHK